MKSLNISNEFSYLTVLKSSTQEVNLLIDEVAVNETWFFRDDAPFTALSSYAKEWLKSGKGSHFRILSIPCSTGEEPYSIAISLLEAGISEKFFSIDAVDISHRSLQVAKNAIYRERSFRGLNSRIKKLYFKQTKNGYSLNDGIKKNIFFSKGNLINFNLPVAANAYNVIFCRNLLIYFDNSFHQQALGTLHKLLRDDGLLFIGHAEAGLFIDSHFTPAQHKKAFAYFKKDFAESVASEELIESQNFGSHIPIGKQPDPFSYDELNSTITDEQLTSAQHEADQGNYEKAIHLCEKAIKINGPSSPTFFLLGVIFDELMDYRNAIKMFKKAIYLNPNFLEAIDLLAAIYNRLGDESNANSYVNRSRRVRDRLLKSMARKEEL